MVFKGFINQQTSLEAGIVGRWFLFFYQLITGGAPFFELAEGNIETGEADNIYKVGPPRERSW